MFLSALYLTVKEKIERDVVLNNSSWIVYFQTPRGNDIDFSIENYTSAKNYAWEIILDDTKIAEGKTSVQNKEKKNIDISGIDKDLSSEKYQNKKILIRISAEGEKKEIYKFL